MMGAEEYSVEELKAYVQALEDTIVTLSFKKNVFMDRIAVLLHEQGDSEWQQYYFRELR